MTPNSPFSPSTDRHLAQEDVAYIKNLQSVHKASIATMLAVAFGLIAIGLFAAVIKLTNTTQPVAQAAPPAQPDASDLQFKMEKGIIGISLKDGKVTPYGEIDMTKTGKAFWQQVEATYPDVSKRIIQQYLITTALRDNPEVIQWIGQQYVQALVKQQEAAKTPATPSTAPVQPTPVQPKR